MPAVRRCIDLHQHVAPVVARPSRHEPERTGRGWTLAYLADHRSDIAVRRQCVEHKRERVVVLSHPAVGRDQRRAQLTLRSWPSQYGARNSRFSTFIAPDSGSGSARNSTDLGTL